MDGSVLLSDNFYTNAGLTNGIDVLKRYGIKEVDDMTINGSLLEHFENKFTTKNIAIDMPINLESVVFCQKSLVSDNPKILALNHFINQLAVKIWSNDIKACNAIDNSKSYLRTVGELMHIVSLQNCANNEYIIMTEIVNSDDSVTIIHITIANGLKRNVYDCLVEYDVFKRIRPNSNSN